MIQDKIQTRLDALVKKYLFASIDPHTLDELRSSITNVFLYYVHSRLISNYNIGDILFDEETGRLTGTCTFTPINSVKSINISLSLAGK